MSPELRELLKQAERSAERIGQHVADAATCENERSMARESLTVAALIREILHPK